METRRTANSRHADISPLAWAHLTDAELPDTYDGWELFCLQGNDFDHELGYKTEDIWALYCEEILANWIKDKPGTRPNCWWRYSAPEPRRSETEPDYLARHGLLTPDEKRRLETND